LTEPAFDRLLRRLSEASDYDELCAEATEAEVLDTRVLVCSFEDLKAMKRAAGRTRDKADLEDLDAAGR
jgi:hypothetical protein